MTIALPDQLTPRRRCEVHMFLAARGHPTDWLDDHIHPDRLDPLTLEQLAALALDLHLVAVATELAWARALTDTVEWWAIHTQPNIVERLYCHACGLPLILGSKPTPRGNICKDRATCYPLEDPIDPRP